MLKGIGFILFAIITIIVIASSLLVVLDCGYQAVLATMFLCLISFLIGKPD